MYEYNSVYTLFSVDVGCVPGKGFVFLFNCKKIYRHVQTFFSIAHFINPNTVAVAYFQ